MNFDLLYQVLRSEIFLNRDGQLRAVHVILGFKPISTRFQVSKNIIKARDPWLALVDVVIEGLIQKPPPTEAQPVELPIFTDPQPLIEEVISSNDKLESQSEGTEEETQEESIESLIHDEDFEDFYHQDETEDIASNSRLVAALVSADQEAIAIPEAMVLEKIMSNLLSLLESHAGGATPEVPIMPRPPTPAPPPPSQTKTADKK